MTSHVCAAGCGRPGPHACARCTTAFYCSRECQKVDWMRHKTQCFGKSDASDSKADSKAVRIHERDVVPEQVVEAFAPILGTKKQRRKTPRNYGQTRVEKLIRGKSFELALKGFPQSHVEFAKWAMKRIDKSDYPHGDEQLRTFLTVIRLQNPMCSACGEKDKMISQFYCKHCHLHSYCSKACQVAHWKAHHKKWCAQMIHEPFDPKDPLLPLFITTNKEREDRVPIAGQMSFETLDGKKYALPKAHHCLANEYAMLLKPESRQ